MIIGHTWRLGDNSVGLDFNEARFTAELNVFSDTAEDTGVAVIEYLRDNGIWFGSYYDVGNDSEPAALFESIDPPKLANGSCTTWVVKVNYLITGFNGGDPPGPGGDPTSLPATISTNTVGRSEVVEKAIYYGGYTSTKFVAGQETALTNSALTPFSPAPTRDVYNRSIRITRNFLSITINESNLPTEWVNEKKVTFFDPYLTQIIPVEKRCLKCNGWVTEPGELNGIRYVSVTFEGEIKRDTWDHFIKDHGPYVETIDRSDARNYITESVPAGTACVRTNVDQFGHPVESFLDGNGNPVEPPNCDKRYYGQWGFERTIDLENYRFFSGLIL